MNTSCTAGVAEPLGDVGVSDSPQAGNERLSAMAKALAEMLLPVSCVIADDLFNQSSWISSGSSGYAARWIARN